MVDNLQGKDLFPEWATEYNLSLDEILAVESSTWHNILVARSLLVFKGLGAQLTDEQFHTMGTKFGRVWTSEDYKKTPTDTTIKHRDTKPVSYFQTNNIWGARDMKYHADMAHTGDTSFPARALYMVKGALNQSGQTAWLNLELAWEQFTQEEQDKFKDYLVVQQDMYVPGTNLVKFPFLKTNPNSGKLSPRINCYVTPGKNQTAWVHHIEKDDLAVRNTGVLIEQIYRLCETKSNVLYSHTWDDGDLIVYDNWNSVHKRTEVTLSPGEADRLLKRLTFNI